MKVFVRKQTGDGIRLRAARAAAGDARQSVTAAPIASTRCRCSGRARSTARRPSPCRRMRSPAPTTSCCATRSRPTCASRRNGRRASFASKRFACRCCARGCSPSPRRWVKPAAIGFDVQVSYLAGGGAGGWPVRLRTALAPRTTTFPDFDDYRVRRRQRHGGTRGARRCGGAFRRLPLRRCRRATTTTPKCAAPPGAGRPRAELHARRRGRRAHRRSRTTRRTPAATTCRAISSPSSSTAIRTARR